MKRIAILGPNPAWQKTLFFERFRYGEINRAVEIMQFPAGKGINFCRAATCHGHAAGTLIQFTGGENGDRIRQELNQEGMSVHSIQTEKPTRCCTTCLCRATQTMTEVIEPSYAATPGEVQALLDDFRLALEASGAAAFCGTLPTGTDPSLYFRAAQIVLEQKKPLTLDSYQNLKPILESGVEIRLKINVEELQAMTGETTVAAGLKAVLAYPGVKFAAITDGPGKAYASNGERMMTYAIPKLEKVVNPIGCGDTASAILTSELLNGTDPFEAFRLALAAASANCLTPFPGSFDPADAAQIAAEIQITGA